MVLRIPYIKNLPFTFECLYYSYIIEHLDQYEVAVKYETTQKVVWRALKNFGIKTRPRNSWAFYDQTGIKNSQWKGSAASYFTLHARLRRNYGTPRHCEMCHSETKRSYDWANLTGIYDDPDDYIRLCRSCHWKLDEQYLNFYSLKETPSYKRAADVI